MLLVVEDFQWVDATTRELLDRLVRRAQDLPILIVVTFRTEIALPWQDLPNVTDLALAPLDREASTDIVKSVLQNRYLPVT